MNDDLISRQAVLDGIASIAGAKAKSDAQKSLIGRVMFFTEQLPSVNPQEPITDRIEYGTDGNAYRLTISNGNEFKQEPKTGHWIELGCVGNDNYDFECSECHHTDTHSKTVKVNYCWYCGARMVEPQESEDKG